MRGPGDTLDVYEEWASSYEGDLLSEYGYVAPRIAVDAFTEACTDQDTSIIDFGCGTGLVGVELAGRGYRAVDGIDISPAMLAQATEKDVYRELLQEDLSTQTTLRNDTYGGAIAVGCFGSGHLGSGHLGELIRPVSEGGIIVLYINGVPYIEDDYPSHFQQLEAQHWWTLLKIEQSNYMETRERPGWVVVARRGDAAILK